MSQRPIAYQQLIAYAAGELGGCEAAEVESRLAADPEAAATVARYRAAQAIMHADDGVEPPPEALARAKAAFRGKRAPAAGAVARGLQAVARLIFDSRVEPALAGLRGQATGFELTYELPGAQLDIEAELAEQAGDRRYRLVGQITARRALPPLRVKVFRAGSDRIVAETDTDERGMFLLRVEAGDYDMGLDLPGRVAVVPGIRIP